MVDLFYLKENVANEADPATILPPEYKIDDFHPQYCRDEDEKRPIEVALRFWAVIDSDKNGNHRRDNLLLEPEITARDICQFDNGMNNGIAVSLSYCGGPHAFVRALRAVRKIGSKKFVPIFEEAYQILENYGVVFLDPPLDPYFCDDGIDYESVKKIRKLTQELNDRYWDVKFDIYLELLNYLQRERTVLQSRYPAKLDSAQ